MAREQLTVAAAAIGTAVVTVAFVKGVFDLIELTRRAQEQPPPVAKLSVDRISSPQQYKKQKQIDDTPLVDAPFIKLDNNAWCIYPEATPDQPIVVDSFLVHGMNHKQLAHLGDGLLEWIVRELTFDLFPNLSSYDVTIHRNHVVSTVALAPLSRKYNLRAYSNLPQNGRNDAELFEAYAAGLVLEKGYPVARKWLRAVYTPLIKQVYSEAPPVAISTPAPAPPPIAAAVPATPTRAPSAPAAVAPSPALVSASAAKVNGGPVSRQTLIDNLPGNDPTSKLAFRCVIKKQSLDFDVVPVAGQKDVYRCLCTLNNITTEGEGSGKQSAARRVAAEAMLQLLPDAWFGGVTPPKPKQTPGTPTKAATPSKSATPMKQQYSNSKLAAY